MKLGIQKSELFKRDYTMQFGWYLARGGPDVAWRFHAALSLSFNKLAELPDLGRLRHFRNPRLRGLRSFPVERPFNQILIFYQTCGDALHAIRLMHGARDLPRRLLQPPGGEND